jgi:predicted ATP-binding protein involved in virulence
MKTLLAPSIFLLLVAVCAANLVAAQIPKPSPTPDGTIPFVTQATPIAAPTGAIIRLKVQYNGDASALSKYRLSIGGVTARFFLLKNDTDTISAVVPIIPSAGAARVPIVFFSPTEVGGLTYDQFTFLVTPQDMPRIVPDIVNVAYANSYYDVTFTNSIPVPYWGRVKILFNNKLAEIVKMEDRVFTVTLPNGVESNGFKVTWVLGDTESSPYYYGSAAPSPTPTSTVNASVSNQEDTSWLKSPALILTLIVMVGIGAVAAIRYWLRTARLRALSSQSQSSPYREHLHLPGEVPPDLVQACRNGECVLYAGAGLSAQCGLPTWTPFVHGLLDWARTNNVINEAEATEYHDEVARGQADPVADNLVSRLTTEDDRAALNDYLRKVFLKRTSPSPLHERLKQIEFSAILTTNFDNVLERVFEGKTDQTYTPKDSESLLTALTRRAFFILKLYGRLDRQETVLVAPAQYNSAISGNSLFSEFMQTLFFSRTILFLGASIEGIEAYLTGIAMPDTFQREHYAVVAVTGNAWRAKADLLQRRYGIKVLPYTPSEDFAELKDFVDKLGEVVSNTDATPTIRGSRVSKLSRVILNNIGPFESLTLDLELKDEEKWHVFLGDNGVGKSTVLKAIALALCGKDAQQYAGRLLRYKETNPADVIRETIGTITLETDNKTSYVTTIKRDDRTGVVELSSTTARPLEAEGWLAIGFPPLRTTSWEVTPKGPEADSKVSTRPVVTDLLPLVKGDVDPRLDKLKQWIVNLDYRAAKSDGTDSRSREQIQKVFDIIGNVAEGMSLTYKGVGSGNRILVTTPDGTLVPLEGLSQGTISLLGWIGILIQRMYEVFGQDSDPTKRYALVLMDEIDAHMHPLWQRILVDHLKEIFPDVQFIATTHSPLVIGGMPARQVIRFGKDKSGKPVLLPVPPDATLGYSDQVLTSMLFDLPTSLDHTTAKKSKRYDELVQKGTLNSDEKELYETLKQDLIARVPASPGNYAQNHAAQVTKMEMLRRLGENLKETAPEEAQVLLKRAEKLSETVGGPQSNDPN